MAAGGPGPASLRRAPPGATRTTPVASPASESGVYIKSLEQAF
jgi:hypothetical protein